MTNHCELGDIYFALHIFLIKIRFISQNLGSNFLRKITFVYLKFMKRGLLSSILFTDVISCNLSNNLLKVTEQDTGRVGGESQPFSLLPLPTTHYFPRVFGLLGAWMLTVHSAYTGPRVSQGLFSMQWLGAGAKE